MEFLQGSVATSGGMFNNIWCW